MNETIQLLKNHASIRKFDLDYTIPETDFKEMLAAARQASTWMNGEFYSIIVVRDPEKRRKVYEAAPAHMTFIEKCNELFLFVGDLHRTQVSAKMHEVPYEACGIEPILMGTVDASLAAQNLVVAAESLGLGAVFVGMVRTHAQEIANLFHLPEKTFPLFAVAVGKPMQEMQVKPRLPEQMVVHFEEYREPEVVDFEKYNAVQTDYAGARQQVTWTEKFANFFSRSSHQESEKQLKKAKLLK